MTKHKHDEYYPLHGETIRSEVSVIQHRVNARARRGMPTPSELVWKWIKDRHPTWHELDRQKVWQQVRR